MTEKEGLVSRRTLDLLFILQIAFNILVLCAVLAGLVYVIGAMRAGQDRQLDAIQEQNRVQICGVHDLLEAQRAIALSLGLPVAEKIVPPDVEGLGCPEPSSFQSP